MGWGGPFPQCFAFVKLRKVNNHLGRRLGKPGTPGGSRLDAVDIAGLVSSVAEVVAGSAK